MRTMLARHLQTVGVSLVLLSALVGVLLWTPILAVLTAVTNARSRQRLSAAVHHRRAHRPRHQRA